MIAKKWIIISFAALTPSFCHAFFCPSNFNQIYFGDSLAQVKQQCGTPSKEEIADIVPNVPQEWTYYIPQTVSSDTLQAMNGTLKTQVAFDKDGHAISIMVNGVGVGSTTICGNTVQLGDPQESVKSACGTPSFINKQALPPNASAGKLTTLTYDSNTPVKLIFKNGILTDKQ